MPHRVAERFDFDLPRHARVWVCRRVADGAPILNVRNDEHEWQFLCGAVHAEAPDDPPVVHCLECTVAADPTLNELATMRCDSEATRTHVGAPWAIHDGVLESIRDRIDEYDWAVQLVPGVEGEPQPPFAYTVGLYEKFGHPELLVMGLHHETMHGMLNICGEMVKAGTVLREGELIEGVLEAYPVRVRAVREDASYRAYVGCAIDHYARRAFPLMQVIWPDREGVFPDAANAPAWMSDNQRLPK